MVCLQRQRQFWWDPEVLLGLGLSSGPVVVEQRSATVGSAAVPATKLKEGQALRESMPERFFMGPAVESPWH